VFYETFSPEGQTDSIAPTVDFFEIRKAETTVNPSPFGRHFENQVLKIKAVL